MLRDQVNRYIELRQTLGYKLRDNKRELNCFAQFVNERSENYITTANASAWANLAPSPYARDRRMRQVVHLAQFLRLEDPNHELPSRELFKHRYARPLPYIYSKEEIGKLMLEAGRLRRQPKTNPIRPEIFSTLIGLIASTGLRISEALNLRLGDVGADGTLHIRLTKFGKSRYVPVHSSVLAKLNEYLEVRGRIAVADHDHIFISMNGRKLPEKMAQWTFAEILKRAAIAKDRAQKPRIHDLRHTFATRALEKCPSDRNSVAKHFVALSTYLGHVDIKTTYWYLEATPELMNQFAVQAEEFITSAGIR